MVILLQLHQDVRRFHEDNMELQVKMQVSSDFQATCSRV